MSSLNKNTKANDKRPRSNEDKDKFDPNKKIKIEATDAHAPRTRNEKDTREKNRASNKATDSNPRKLEIIDLTKDDDEEMRIKAQEEEARKKAQEEDARRKKAASLIWRSYKNAKAVQEAKKEMAARIARAQEEEANRIKAQQEEANRIKAQQEQANRIKALGLRIGEIAVLPILERPSLNPSDGEHAQKDMAGGQQEPLLAVAVHDADPSMPFAEVVPQQEKKDKYEIRGPKNILPIMNARLQALKALKPEDVDKSCMWKHVDALLRASKKVEKMGLSESVTIKTIYLKFLDSVGKGGTGPKQAQKRTKKAKNVRSFFNDLMHEVWEKRNEPLDTWTKTCVPRLNMTSQQIREQTKNVMNGQKSRTRKSSKGKEAQAKDNSSSEEDEPAADNAAEEQAQNNKEDNSEHEEEDEAPNNKEDNYEEDTEDDETHTAQKGQEQVIEV